MLIKGHFNHLFSLLKLRFDTLVILSLNSKCKIKSREIGQGIWMHPHFCSLCHWEKNRERHLLETYYLLLSLLETMGTSIYMIIIEKLLSIMIKRYPVKVSGKHRHDVANCSKRAGNHKIIPALTLPVCDYILHVYISNNVPAYMFHKSHYKR